MAGAPSAVRPEVEFPAPLVPGRDFVHGLWNDHLDDFDFDEYDAAQDYEDDFI